jgi:hypothetical protein
MANPWQGAHGDSPRTTGHRHGEVVALEMNRGRGATSRRKLTGAAMARQLSDVEGVDVVGQ